MHHPGFCHSHFFVFLLNICCCVFFSTIEGVDNSHLGTSVTFFSFFTLLPWSVPQHPWQAVGMAGQARTPNCSHLYFQLFLLCTGGGWAGVRKKYSFALDKLINTSGDLYFAISCLFFHCWTPCPLKRVAEACGKAPAKIRLQTNVLICSGFSLGRRASSSLFAMYSSVDTTWFSR